MLYPIQTQEFKNVTIGYFDWVVEDKMVRVIRIVGKKNGFIFDKLFKLDMPISKVFEELL